MPVVLNQISLPIDVQIVGAMTLAQARTIASLATRNAGDNQTYDNTDFDLAIRKAAKEFQQLSGCAPIATVNGPTVASTGSLAGFPADLHPSNVTAISIGDFSVTQTDYQTIMKLRSDSPATGRPTHIAFVSWSTAALYPTPDDVYQVSITYEQPFTQWTPGTTDPITLNYPQEWMLGILMFGVPATLQRKEPENAGITSALRKDWENFCLQMNGESSLGTTQYQMERGD